MKFYRLFCAASAVALFFSGATACATLSRAELSAVRDGAVAGEKINEAVAAAESSEAEIDAAVQSGDTSEALGICRAALHDCRLSLQEAGSAIDPLVDAVGARPGSTKVPIILWVVLAALAATTTGLSIALAIRGGKK